LVDKSNITDSKPPLQGAWSRSRDLLGSLIFGISLTVFQKQWKTIKTKKKQWKTKT